jgi:tRNA-splicing ligase RtcB
MSEKNLIELSPYKSEWKTGKMKVPVVFHIQKDLMPGQATLDQLESVASNDTVFHHIAAMADVHSKPGRKNATGTTVTSERYILPQVNDSDPACGMRLVKTNLNEDNITPEELDTLFKALVDTVPTKAYVGTYLPFRVIVDICRQGIAPLIKHLGIETKNETTHCLENGNFFDQEKSRKDIFAVIPKLFLFFAQFRSGVLGAAGNHFLDLMKVTDILDEETAQKFGLRRGQYVFMVHCGSGILGQYTMYMYTAKKREHLSQAIMVTLGRLSFFTPFKKTINAIAAKIRAYEFGSKEELFTYDGSSEAGKLYMAARNACSNFAHANRAVITHNVSQTIKKVLGRDPEMELLYDMPHILVSQEKHYDKDIWVHRNGTSRAYGPSRMQGRPLFQETGEPTFIPSSMSTEAYLCVGTDNNASSFYSCNHGAGKAAEKTDTVVPRNKTELDTKLQARGVKLYNGRSSKVIEQDSSNYKRIEDIMDSVTHNEIVRPVAKMQPISIIMY